MQFPSIGNRWVVFGAAIVVEQVAGFMYMFGLLSETLKGTFHLDQSDLAIVGSSATVGSQFGIHMGFFFDAFGPRATVGFGGFLTSSAFFVLWLAIRLNWEIGTGLLSIITFVSGQGQLSVDLAVIPTLAANFPHNRGMAIGTAKAFVGLSGSLATALYQGFFAPDVTNFLLLLVVWIVLSCGIGLFFIEECPRAESPEQRLVTQQQLLRGFNIVYGLCALLLFVALFEGLTVVSQSVRILLVFVVFLFDALAVTYLVSRKDAAGADVSPVESQESQDVSEPTETGQQYTLMQALCTHHFWILFLASAFGVAGGLMVLNNIAQVNLALGRDENSGIVFVSLLSISNCIGRIGIGSLSDRLVNRHPGFPRPLVLAGTSALAGALLLLFSLLPSAATLYALVPVISAGYGAVNALNPVIASDIFGTKYLGQIYMGLSLSMAISGYGFATIVFGRVYDAHSDGACIVEHMCLPGGSPSCAASGKVLTSCCLGPACTGTSFKIVAGSLFAAACLFGILAHTAKGSYSRKGIATMSGGSLLQGPAAESSS